ncbi:MAG: efflux RND transporter permease subunit [Clostridia bacterium]|nr:efflux RND transporter permease subunit [Clostridia bacterium]
MISKFSVKKPFTVLVAVILVLVLGTVSVTRMTPDLLPEMSFPYIVLVTTYAGAAPEEVENTVSKPLEQSLAALDDLKTVSSVSSENVSVVYLTFEDTVNTDRAMLDIQQVVTKLKGDWPEAVGTPTTLELSTDLIPTVVAAVHYKDMDPVALSGFVSEKLLPALEGTNGVASVNATGLVTERIEIELNKEKIDALNKKLYGSIDEAAKEAFDKIDEGQQKLDEGRQELEDAKAELEKGELAYKHGSYAAYQGFKEAETELDQNKEQLTAAIAQMEAQRAELVRQRDEAQPMRQLLTALQGSIDLMEGSKAVLEASIAEINASETMTAEEKAAALAVPQAELDGVNQALAAIDGQLGQYGITRDQIPGLLAQFDQLDQGIALLDENLAAAKDGLAQVEGGYDELEKQKSAVNGQLSYAQKQIDEGRKQIEDGALELENGQQQLDDALKQAQEQLAAAKEAADLNTILTKELVAQLVQAQNFEMPAGYVDDGDVSWIVNVGDKVRDVEALENVAILSLGLEGLDVVRLVDVADVYIVDNSDTTYARINGENGVLLTFTRQSAYATATVADNIDARFRELESQYPGLKFVALMDQGDYIHMAISAVVQSLLLGGALAIFILFLFLRDIRPTFAVGISIPVSVLFALVLMYFSGVTMNVISMAGLAIGIGMLVDNSIVVIENIYRLLAEGVAPRDAAIQGAQEVMGAITASTLTTVCVFLPVFFIHGMTRQVFMDMILTITYSLMASLIVALTVIPAMAQGLLRRQVRSLNALERKLISAFEKAVRFNLRHRVLALLLALALLGASAWYSLKQGFEYFPESGGTQISITVTAPEDYTFADRCFLADEMMCAMESVPHLTDIGGMINGGMESLVGLTASEGDQITVYALVDENSGYSSIEAMKDIRKALEPFHREADFEVSSVSTMSMSSMMQSGGFTMNIFSNDLEDLRTAAATVAEKLKTVEGLKEISGGAEETTPALHITVDKEKAIAHNLTTAQVYLAIVQELTSSVKATQVATTTSALSATIHAPDGETDRQKLEKMTITSTLRDGTTEEVPLKDIITITETETLSSIHRLEQRRYISVTASVADGYNVTLVSTAARQALEGVALPEGCQVEYAGENETIMDAMKDLFFMLLLGVLIIYLIMVAQFQSLLSPFIVILTVPLSFAGGFLGLLVTDFHMSIVSMVGMIMLVGVVVNNGIVLVDCANRLREEGLTKREAIVKAATMRIRPVLMTALTTILGLLPLGIGLGTGAEIIQPVAIVCIGGLTYATLMTVFIVPVLYDLLRRDKKPRPAPAPESAPAPEPVNVPEPAPAAVPEAAPAAPKELSEEMKILLEIRDALKK